MLQDSLPVKSAISLFFCCFIWLTFFVLLGFICFGIPSKHLIAHRDVRSDNLLLNKHGIIKLGKIFHS